MIDLIQAHLDAIERIQSDLEKKIREALGNVTPQEILERADELPAEIAAELRDWIEHSVLQDLIDESQQFLRVIEDEADEDIAANEDKIRHFIALLLDDYLAVVTIVTTAAFAEIQTRANTQIALGRSEDLILEELAGETAGIGGKLKAMVRRIVIESDSFIGSAGGIIPIATAKDSLVWITVQDSKVCVDCQPRHGEVHTAAEWVDLGLPRTGWSVCSGYCRCILVPQSVVAKFGLPAPVVRPRRKG